MVTIIQDFNSDDVWVAPTGVTVVRADVWGAGGKGSTRTTNGAGGGGGGGAYAALNAYAVTPGNSYSLHVGLEADSSWFSSTGTVFAPGGSSVANNTTTGGTGGSAGSAIGDVVRSGGNGANGSGSNGGGGGGSGGNSSDGGNGSGSTGGTAGTGTPPGAVGGDGGVSNNDGGGGALPGAGGGGAHRSSGTRNGGAGGRGRVRLTWDYPGDFYITSYSTASANSGGAGVGRIDKPSDVQENDLLVAHVGADNNGTISPPSGWTSIRKTSDGGGTSFIESFYKVATSSEPSTYDFTNSFGSTFAGISMESIRGADVSDPIAADSGNNAGSVSSPITNSGVTPVNPDSMILFAVMTANISNQGNSVGNYACATSNPTWIMSYDIVQGTNAQHLAWAIRSQTTATGNCTATVTQTGTGTNFIQMIVINKAQSGPAGVKTFNGIVAANIKTFNGVPYGDVKSLNGIT